MTISLTVKPLEVEAEINPIGTFYVRRMGAAMECEIQSMLREHDDKNAKYSEKYEDITNEEKDLIAKNDKEGLKNLRASKLYLEAEAYYKEINQDLERIRLKMYQILCSLFRSDEKDAKEKLCDLLTMDQLQDVYNQIMNEARND